MTLKRVEIEFSRLQERRDAVDRQEKWVQNVVGELLRQQTGSQRELAHRLGITVAYLSDIIHGRRKISGGIMARLVKHL